MARLIKETFPSEQPRPARKASPREGLQLLVRIQRRPRDRAQGGRELRSAVASVDRLTEAREAGFAEGKHHADALLEKAKSPGATTQCRNAKPGTILYLGSRPAQRKGGDPKARSTARRMPDRCNGGPMSSCPKASTVGARPTCSCRFPPRLKSSRRMRKPTRLRWRRPEKREGPLGREGAREVPGPTPPEAKRGPFSFEEALLRMKEGKQVRRLSWGSGGLTVMAPVRLHEECLYVGGCGNGSTWRVCQHRGRRLGRGVRVSTRPGSLKLPRDSGLFGRVRGRQAVGKVRLAAFIRHGLCPVAACPADVAKWVEEGFARPFEAVRANADEVPEMQLCTGILFRDRLIRAPLSHLQRLPTVLAVRRRRLRVPLLPGGGRLRLLRGDGARPGSLARPTRRALLEPRPSRHPKAGRRALLRPVSSTPLRRTRKRP